MTRLIHKSVPGKVIPQLKVVSFPFSAIRQREKMSASEICKLKKETFTKTDILELMENSWRERKNARKKACDLFASQPAAGNIAAAIHKAAIGFPKPLTAAHTTNRSPSP